VFKESELATLAGLKSAQLAEWRNEKLALAATIAENSVNVDKTKRLIENPDSESVRASFLEGLDAIQRNFLYVRAAMVLRAAGPS